MWTDVHFDEVKIEDELLPEAEYAFRVRYASKDKFDPEKISVSLSVAAGDHEGQTVYMKFPSPAKAGKGIAADDPRNWVVKAVTQFLQAIKALPLAAGEHPIDAINRVARASDVYIVARVKHRTYTGADGELKTSLDFVFRSIKPARLEKQDVA